MMRMRNFLGPILILTACGQSQSLGDVDAADSPNDSGRCIGDACACSAGEIRCSSSGAPELCSSAARWEAVGPCSAEQICRGGLCEPNPTYDVGSFADPDATPFEMSPDTLYLTQVRISRASQTQTLFARNTTVDGACLMVLYDDVNGYPSRKLAFDSQTLELTAMTDRVLTTRAVDLEAGAAYWVGGTCTSRSSDDVELLQASIPNARLITLDHAYGEFFPVTFPEGAELTEGVAIGFGLVVRDAQ